MRMDQGKPFFFFFVGQKLAFCKVQRKEPEKCVVDYMVEGGVTAKEITVRKGWNQMAGGRIRRGQTG